MSSPEFAAAQERVLARRRQRALEALSRTEAEQRRPGAARIAQLSNPLRSIGQSTLDIWDAIKGREGTGPAFRVGQVDSELLDEELLSLLKSQVGDALKYFGPHLSQDWSSEILLVLRAALFKLSIWDNNASYGASLQGLTYTDARHQGAALQPPSNWQKALYGLFTIAGKYGWTKWEDFLAKEEGGYHEPSANIRALSRLSSLVSATHDIAALGSFVVFLVNGRYRTLTDRMLRLRLVAPTNQISREVSFEYLNRQLVWHAFTEFLLFLLPLVGISRWRRWLTRAWKKAKDLVRSGADDGDERHKAGELGFLPERTCAICYQEQNPTSTSETEILAATGASGGVIGSAQTDVTNPYESMPCGCIYCFVCIATRLEAEEGEGFICLKCGELVKECKPWSGDVVEVLPCVTNGKSVTFIDEQEHVQIDTVDITTTDDTFEDSGYHTASGTEKSNDIG